MKMRRKKRNRRTVGTKRTLKRMELKKTVVCFLAAVPVKMRTNLTVTKEIKMKK